MHRCACQSVAGSIWSALTSVNGEVARDADLLTRCGSLPSARETQRDRSADSPTDDGPTEWPEHVDAQPPAPWAGNGDLAPAEKIRDQAGSEIPRRVEAGLGQRRDHGDDGCDSQADEQGGRSCRWAGGVAVPGKDTNQKREHRGTDQLREKGGEGANHAPGLF